MADTVAKMIPSSRILAALLLVLLGGLALVPGGRPAMAHAVLLETTPAGDSLLAEMPRAVELRFNEPVTPIALQIIGRGATRALAAVAQDDRITAEVPHDLTPGSYLVSYRVVSADSHPVSGAFLFTVGAPTGDTPQAPDLYEREESWSLLVALNRILLLGSLAFAAGGALFAANLLGAGHPLNDDLQRPLRIAALLAMAAALIAVPLQGGLLTAAAFGQTATWLDGAILRAGWHSHLGTSTALIGAGLAAVVLGAASRRLALLALSAAGAVFAAGALAASGHAATAAPRWLAVLAMVCHAVAVTFWAGALWPLLRSLTLPHDEAARVIRRFSAWAVVAVIVLVAAGLVLAVLQLDGDASTLVTTAYGQLLLLKLGLVALLLLLAVYNKWRLTPALARGESGATARLAGAIRLEIAAIGLIFAVTALLGQTPPPRAIALADRTAGASQSAHSGHAIAPRQSVTAITRGYVATATLTPARTGRNTLAVALRGPDGAPFAALETRAELQLPEAGVDELSLPLPSVAPGRYETATDALIRAGIWQLRLVVLINDFEQVTFEMAMPVR